MTVVATIGGSARGQADGKPVRIVVLGDSLTAGYMLPGAAAFPAVLERSLRSAGMNVEVVNAGVSGDTSTGGLERLDWAIGEGADALIVELGANDMLRGLNPDITYHALGEIVARAKSRNIRVLLAGMVAAPGIGREYEERFNGIFARVSREQDVPLYGFFLDGVAGEPKLQLGDGMHPNTAGVEIIVGRILPMVRELVAPLATRS